MVYVEDVGLLGKSDGEILEYAWREKRLIWTHDRDFLNDTRFPEDCNPGVVVLPGGDGDQHDMAVGITIALTEFGQGPDTWMKTKSIISPKGEMYIRRRNGDSGKMETTRYRMTRGEYAEEWIET